jgi:hypothetical protein
LPILDQWDLEISVDEILQAQGGDPAGMKARSPQLAQIAEQALAEGSGYIHPRVKYQVYALECVLHNQLNLSGGGHISGSLVVEHLAAAEQIAVIVCTVGSQIEIHAAHVMTSNPSYGLALNGLGSAAVEVLGNAVCIYFEGQALHKGHKTTAPINPGMEGWSLKKGQKQILDLLDLTQVGVHMNPSGMMRPIKSLTMVIGMGPAVMKTGNPCDYCSSRDRCQYRSD